MPTARELAAVLRAGFEAKRLSWDRDFHEFVEATLSKALGDAAWVARNRIARDTILDWLPADGSWSEPASQSEIGRAVGISREYACRHLAALERSGAIERELVHDGTHRVGRYRRARR